jgi:rhodanese-related sulfurtransferase
MSFRYIILAIILLGAAFGLTLLPEKGYRSVVSPGDVLLKSTDQSRFLSTHDIAARIIERDPSILLIDIRMFDEYEAYNIPGSVNIPLEEILLENWRPYLNQDAMDIVFYSNSDVFAEQAWNLCYQSGYKNLYIMKGGLNQWFASIIQPTMPEETAPSEAFDLYSFERAASIYFGGTPVGAETTAPVTKKKVVVRKKEKKAAEGGC